MFKKLIVTLAIVALLASPVCAKNLVTNDITTAAGSTSIYVPTTSSVVTTYFVTSDTDNLGISFMASSAAGDPRFTAVLEQSNVKPTTDGAAEPAVWSVPVGATNVVTTFSGTESVWYHTAYSPIAMKYGRFKITGTTGNATTDTVVTLKVNKRIN